MNINEAVSRIAELPELEEKCKYCGGNPYRDRCTNCSGRGTVPTDLGQAIINLIVKYLPNSAPTDD